MWSEVFYNKKFCGTNLPGNSGFINVEYLKDNESCQPKWTKCKSKNNKWICVPGLICPINGISNTSFNDTNEIVIKIGDHKLYLSSVQDNSPVTQIQIELDAPCVDRKD